MRTVQVELGDRSYPVFIGPGLLAHPTLLSEQIRGGQVFILSNDVVAPLYLREIERRLGNLQVDVHVLPDGEQFKNLQSFGQTLDAMLSKRHHRSTTVVALGGGVVGDIAGFVAASYQRGVDFVQCPTTLLAQVDSSVGGKTAVNHPAGKNMIGAFYQPRAVIADTDVLSTLPKRELSAGIAEIIKYGVIADKQFFAWLEDNVDRLRSCDADALAHAIARSVEIKAAVVSQDERELGVRAHLNFGHTFGHAIEHVQGYGKWLHGEAVGAGMVLAARLSAQRGLLGAEAEARVVNLIQRAGLPTDVANMSAEALLNAMALDKKVQNGELRFVLAHDIGQAGVHGDIPRSMVAQILAASAGH